MRHKADIGIGHRAYQEVTRMFPKTRHAAIAIGCSKKTLYAWRDGIAPSPLYLAQLCRLGFDVEWILIGRRRKEGKP